MSVVEMTGQRFGRLVVLRREYVDSRKAWWLCKCDCGASHVVEGGRLRSGTTRSCGCLRAEIAAERMREIGRNGRRREHERAAV